MVLNTSEVRNAARRARTSTRKSDETLLREARDTNEANFEIFLSHSFLDRDLVLGTKQLIEESGRTVYVDWIDDGRLDRSQVDEKRAAFLRMRMRQCETLFYAHSPNAAVSRWCPWELGYFDAMTHPDCQVFVLPIVEDTEKFEGQEYLGLYETVNLSTYRHRPRRVREQEQVERERLADLLGIRRPRALRRLL